MSAIGAGEAEYRKRAGCGVDLNDDEWAVLFATERLLYSTAARHWDIAACFCPLCVSWRNLQTALRWRADGERQVGAGI